MREFAYIERTEVKRVAITALPVKPTLEMVVAGMRARRGLSADKVFTMYQRAVEAAQVPDIQ